MSTRRISLLELALIGATRGMLGVGIGLLVGPRLSPARRRMLGKALAATGAIATIPLAARVLWRARVPDETDAQEPYNEGAWRPEDPPTTAPVAP